MWYTILLSEKIANIKKKTIAFFFLIEFYKFYAVNGEI